MSKQQHKAATHLAILGAILLAFFFTKTPPAHAVNNSEEIGAASSLSTCPDVEVIFAHGAATTFHNSEDVAAWHQAFATEFSDAKLTFDYYYLGQSNYYGEPYRGADIGVGSFASAKNTAETYFSAGKSGEFNRSVKAGLAELTGRVNAVIAKCKNTKFIFGGYSEGAYILHKFFNSYPSLEGNRIVFVGTFGDPKLYLPEGEGLNPPACKNKNFSSYRVFAPDCHSHSGILGAEKPDYFPASAIEKAGLWCFAKDPFCSNYFNIFEISTMLEAHTTYTSAAPKAYEQAATLSRIRLAKLFPDYLASSDKTVHSTARDTAILIDSTGSMSKSISKYKNEALKIAETTIKNGGRIALFEYRDLKADGRQYVPKMLCDFSCSFDDFKQKLSNITVSGGGDAPESALSASLGVMNELSWQKGATKSIVLLTDAIYHDADFDGTTLSDVVQRSLEIDPVNFYIIAPSSIHAAYTKLADSSGGKTFNLTAEDIALSSETLLRRPDLSFQSETYHVAVGEVATFFVNTTVSNIDHFEWDLDFDGVFELSTTSPFISTVYPTAQSGFIQSKIVTDDNLSSTASSQLVVINNVSASENSTISNLSITSSGTSATANFEKSAESALIILDDYALGVTTKTTIEIKELTPGSHTLTIAPVSKTGFRGTPATKNFTTSTLFPKAPNTALPRG